MAPILGLFAFDMFGKTGFFYSLIVLFLLFLLARRIVNSPFGLSLRAIRNNPLRASAIGVPVNRRLIAVYTLSALYAGIAGALFTQTTALASLDVFSFERSADHSTGGRQLDRVPKGKKLRNLALSERALADLQTWADARSPEKLSTVSEA